MKSTNQTFKAPGKKINIVTLGCPKNTVDSEKLLKQIESGGYSVFHDVEDFSGGTVIINTCGFINDAKEESIDTILYYTRLKIEGRIEKVIVTGCLSERYKTTLREEIPEADCWYGVESTAGILKELGLEVRNDFRLDRILTSPGHYAYLKISEGCSRTCSFCAIPAIRGKYISRPMEEVAEEARKLAEDGVKELILIAQDLTYYGLDLYKKQMLPNLIEELLKISSVEWIRLHYLYPAGFPQDVIKLMKQNRKLCRYIDIPVQHISDRILGLMKRSHNSEETRNLLYTIRKELPDAAIRTTLIAGHPGESREDFNDLKKFIHEFRFNRLGVFPYSHEEGTYSSFAYKDDIPLRTKKSRVSQLMKIQQVISQEINQTMTGKTLKVLIDRREGDFFAGRTEYDSPEVDQEVLISSNFDLEPGNFYDITITGSTDFDLYGIPA